ncbi:MAG: hypothetical protein R3308_01985 [Thiohalobacterales bacterium]|nr:hypothetical protein [Thiohalobacterales bacterium]
MTVGDAATLGDLLGQNTATLTPKALNDAVAELAAACAIFD